MGGAFYELSPGDFTDLKSWKKSDTSGLDL